MKIKKIDDFKLNESEKVKDDDDYCAEYGFLIEKELHLKDIDGYFDFMYADYDENIITFEYYFDYISDIAVLDRISKYPKFKILGGTHDDSMNHYQICIKFEISLGIVKEKKILF